MTNENAGRAVSRSAEAGTFVVGVDVGTSGVKATAVSIEDGVAVERRCVSIGYRPDGEPSRDPDRWVDASLEALKALELSGERDILGVGFTGQMHALVAVGENLRPLRPAMLWLDYDGAAQLQALTSRHSEINFVRSTGNIPLPDFTLAKWLVAVEHEPGLAKDTRAVLGAKDYVRTVLCDGEVTTDWNEAAGTQLYDPFTRRWADEVATAAGLAVDRLPSVVDSTALVAPPRDRDGVGIGVRGVVGTGDQAAAARAVSAFAEGVVSLSLGTSGVLAARLDMAELPGDWDGRFHLFPLDAAGSFQLIGTIPSVGPTLRWVSQLLRVPIEELSTLARKADSDWPGARFYPYLAGRGAPDADAHQQGALVGLTEKTTSADIAQAVYLGIAFELASIVAEMRALGVHVEKVVCSGAVAADSHLAELIGACADVRCATARGLSASSSGAALLAYDAASLGNRPVLGSLPVSSRQVPPGRAEWQEGREAIVHGLSFSAPVVGHDLQC